MDNFWHSVSNQEVKAVMYGSAMFNTYGKWRASGAGEAFAECAKH
jgi:hypothetical protein